MRTLSLICLTMVLQGCATKVYQAVPHCSLVTPPVVARYVTEGPDEKLIRMTDSYIKQVQAVADCNATIDLVNAANGTK